MRAAVIVAGGEGERLGSAGGKQLALVAGRPVLGHTLAAISAASTIDAIVVVVHPERVDDYRREAIEPVGSPKVVAVVPGGDTRQESVAAGLAAVPADAEVVLVHDGARPLVTPHLVDYAVTELETDSSLDGVVVGHPSYDTLKIADHDDRVVQTVDRSVYWAAQTPQVFRASAIRGAYASALADGFVGTDDASLVERAGGAVRMVLGPRDNIKVTVADDLRVAEALLGHRGREVRMGEMRIGIGYDVHALVDGRPLVLGGLTVPASRGLAGHSDADVLVHAIMDALLGATRTGDIGRLFPDSDPAYAGISSIELLRRVGATVVDAGFRVVDIDAVLVLEAPRISPYRDEMRARIADALGIPSEAVGVKATTTEGLGFAGRGEGVAAQAVALVERIEP